MAKQKLLLVDADPRSLRVLEVSLRKAGYSVTAAPDALRAVEMMELSTPDLVVSDTRLPGMDGFAFRQQLSMRDDWQTIPFMFLSSDTSVESKVKGLELGVEDYLTKPIYIKEIITRVNLVLSRKQREGIELRTSTSKTQFSGSLGDMGLVDLLQTIDISRKSAVLTIQNGQHKGALYFHEGRIVDAELGNARGEGAVFRALIWSDGVFQLEFRSVRRDETIKTTTQAILMEGMRRLDEWGRMLEQLPPLESVFEVSEDALVERLAEIPDEINGVLKLFDGKRSLLEVVQEGGVDDLVMLGAVSKLYFEGLIFATGRTSLMPRSGTPTPPPEEPDDTAGDHDAELAVVPGRDERGGSLVPPPMVPPAVASAASSPTAIVVKSSTAAVPPPPPTMSMPAPATEAPPPSPVPDAAPPSSAVPSAPQPQAPAAVPSQTVPIPPPAVTVPAAAPKMTMPIGVPPPKAAPPPPPKGAAPGAGGTGGKAPPPPPPTAKAAQPPQGPDVATPSDKQTPAGTASSAEVPTAQGAAAAAPPQGAPTPELPPGAVIAAPDPKRDRAHTNDNVAQPAHGVSQGKTTQVLGAYEIKKESGDAASGTASATDGTTRHTEESSAGADGKTTDSYAGEQTSAGDESASEPEESSSGTEHTGEQSGAEGEAAMSKKAKRRKKGGRVEVPAAVEAADNVIQFPAKSATGRVATGVAVGDSSTGISREDLPAQARSDERPEGRKSEITSKSDERAPSGKWKEGGAPEVPANEANVQHANNRAHDASSSSDDWKARGKKREKSDDSAITITGEHPQVADDFFNAPSYEATRDTHHETWDDLKESVEPVDPGRRKAFYAAVGLLALAVAGVGGFLLYTKVFSVQAVELGQGPVNTVLPTPTSVAAAPSQAPAAQPSVGPVAAAEPQVAQATPEASPTAEPSVEASPTEAQGTEASASPAPVESPQAAPSPAEPAPAVSPVAVAAPTPAPSAAAAAAPAGDYATLLAAARRARARDQSAAYEAAIAANPNGSEALSGYAMLLINKSKWQQAADLAGRAVAADPTNSEGWIVLGAAREQLRDRTGSREAYRQCVEVGRGRYVSDCRQMVR